MGQVYLNGRFMPMEEARISPMDRGFLFGEGIYEVIPCHQSKLVGFSAHLARLKNGLTELEIEVTLTDQEWRDIALTLAKGHSSDYLGIYLHVSRGADNRRSHGYPDNLTPTIFAFAFDIAPPNSDGKHPGFKVVTELDKRWRRCHIKSTALLGNVMHFRQAQRQQLNEVILYNDRQELTEASSSNVFVIIDSLVVTPPLDSQLLPGVTRQLLLRILQEHSDIRVEERVVRLDELCLADEVWLTSSTKELTPVIEIDGNAVGNGRPGPLWRQAQRLFNQYKYDY
ncbi:aminotransferase class IV [Aliiglaciecola sp. CAU 1673]|uniref:aminotransferase class IV n=1 Tax=Aliiglaciecola sp. CAU 1673 TaxID=3032595 RepID=UPI0023DB2896|nr:aminotransferase class IV [Aliiglaciecola sp. CAU 1673]MDF2180015.1 aminotransferase class IV [Aliiglaciecola sp. CAU 1673]